MDSKLTVVTGALDAIKKWGWCCIGGHRPDELNIVVKIIEDCGEQCKVVELPNGTMKIFKMGNVK